MVTLILYSAVLMLVLTPFSFLQSGCALGVDALLSAQNKVLCWIEELPMSSIDRLWIDHWEIMLFYLFLLFLFRSLAIRTARSISFPLCCLLLLITYHTISVSLSSPQRGIAFYNVRGCPAVHCVANSGESGWLMLIVCRILSVCTVHSYLIGIVIISLFPMLCLLIILLPVWLFIITLFPMRAGGFACSMMPAGKIRFQSTLYRSIIYTFPKATMVVLKN